MKSNQFSAAKAIFLACAMIFGVSFAQAQVTYYNSNSGPGPITHLSVAGNGDDALTRMGMKTEIHSGGSTSTVSAMIQGVSSNGVFYGTGYDGKFKPIYLDFDGSIKFLNLDPNSSIGQDGGYVIGMEGGFVQTRSTSNIVETFLNGNKLPEVNAPGAEVINHTGITGSGNSLYQIGSTDDSKSLNVVSSQGNPIVKLSSYDGSGILQQGRGPGNISINVNDLAANDRLLFEWENQTDGTKGSGIYNLLSGELTDLSTNGIKALRMKTQGDMLGVTSKPVQLIGYGGGTVLAYEFWFFKNGEGWFNASEINGMAPVLSPYLLSVDLSEGGVISGLLDQSIRVNAEVSQAFRMAPVPEPGTMLLLAAGAGGLMAAKRRRNKQH